jgi:hypothetical protein
MRSRLRVTAREANGALFLSHALARQHEQVQAGGDARASPAIQFALMIPTTLIILYRLGVE